jgi:pimeloyl-ACP methyl ester carboxylesterase
MQIDFSSHYKDKFVKVNGLKLHYTDWGGKSDEYLVLIHGLNVQAHTWDPIADVLRNDYHVLALDLRGHGDSEWAKDGYKVGTFVSDIYEFARKLDLPKFHFVGHSLGARIAIAYGGEHSDTLLSLTLSDTGPEVPRTGALQVRGRAEKGQSIRGFRDEAHALEAIQELQPTWQPIFHQLHVKHQYRLNWANKLVAKADPDLFWITGSVSLPEVPYLWEMAHKISVPTLIMWGETSPLMNEELANRMLEAIPNSRLARFQTDHYIPRQVPEEFTSVLRAFLQENTAKVAAAGASA